MAEILLRFTLTKFQPLKNRPVMLYVEAVEKLKVKLS